MLTPSQLADLTTNANQRSYGQWAIRFRVNPERLREYCKRNGIETKRLRQMKSVDIDYLREHAKERTHKEWAEYFGVTVQRMWVVCSKNRIKVKGSYETR